MLYSHSHQEQSFDYFASFLRNVLRGEDQYKALVEPVIHDARLLAKKEKDYYKITTQSFDVIVYLAQKDPDFFSKLDRDLSTQSHVGHLDYRPARSLTYFTESNGDRNSCLRLISLLVPNSYHYRLTYSHMGI